MKKNILAKSLLTIRTLIAVLCVICGAVPAWGGGHGGPHYASVSVTASPTGQGKVYMTTDKAYAPGSEDWQGSMSDTWNCDDGIGPSEEDTRTYYVHAQAESGYHFAKWSSISSGTDSKSTANPYAYSTSASSTNSGNPTANNIYAIFEANPQYTCTFLTSTNGTYKYQYGESSEVTVTSEHSVTTNQNFTFTALPDPGYQVYGWYTESGGTKTYFNYSSYVLSSYALPGNIRIGVDFMPVGSPIFQIKGSNQMFTDLNAAVTSCGAATKTIVLVNNGTLLAGEYTIPSNVTLLIPFDANYTCYTETPGTIDSYTSPAAYRTLTMSPGARLIVNGKISLSAKVSGLDVQGPNGVASGPYGAIKMLSEGDTQSTITLNSGGKLYCWGYIYGEGKVEALSGAEVHEGFNFMDFRGAQNTYNMNSDSHKVFPFNQYYIQNIEVPLTIHYGATENVFSCLYPGGNEVPIPITMVGSSDGLFRLTGSGSKLTKWYDPHDDRQHYALEGNAAIRNISFTVTLIMSITVNSANFVLPITNNMDIEVRSGANVDIAENVCIMPDASITVEEGATLNIASGKSVYVYDKNAYTNAGTYSTNRGGYPEAGAGRYALGQYIRRANYSPSWATIPDREIRRLAIMHTARFKINGTLNATGKIYTTEGGADIYSDTDGAVINLSTAAGTANVTYQVDHHGYDAYYYSIPITSAQLHNADQSYAPTAGSPAGAAWTYKHGHWGWKVVWMLEDGTVLKTAYHYAQPDASWISSNAPSPSRDPEGTCSYVFNGWNTTTHTENQEVTVVADYTKTCTDYYTITWKSEDGLETLETDAGVGDGENTRYNGATPFKPFDTESSRLYTFDGWATEPDGAKVYDIDGTPAASGDAIYYAHFAVTEVVAIVKADDDTTYCTSIEEAFEVVRNTNFTPTIQVWKDASIPALVYNIENYCTLDLNGHTLTSVTSSVQSPFKINKSNITFTITDSSESQSGKLSMTSTYGSPIFGLFVQNGNLQLNGGTIEVVSGSAITCGVTVNSNCSFTMNGGKIHVVTTNNKEGRGVYSAGTVLINDGTVHVEAAGNAYAMKRDGGTVTVNNGKFNINGSSSYINYGADADANIAIKGGYYTTNNRLATVVPSPYIVYDWASEDEPYRYTVAAKVGYTVTFQNTDGTPLQTGTWVEGTTPAYAGETPTKPGDTEGAWMLGGWTPDLVPVTEDVTYTAVYVPTPPVASVTISGTTTEYIHFNDAWDAVNGATAASTLTLLDDVALASMLTFTSSRNCTFDLNGYTITNTDLVMFNLNNASSTFTLTDGLEGQTGKVVVRSNGASVAYGVLVSKGTFVLNAGTIEAYLQANTSQGVRVANGASFTMEGGTIDVVTTNAKNGDGVFANTTGSATINGGTIRVNAATTGYAVNAVGAVTVTGGHFDAAGGTSATCVAGSPTLQGGYYNINTNLSDNTSAPYYVFPNADETYLYKVSAGYTLTWSTDGELSGEGYTPSGLTEVGTPIVAPTSTKEGYVFAGWSPAVAATMPAANTSYTATWAVASVTINGNTTLYTDFNTAFTAANNSATHPATITLLQNTTIASTLQYTNSNYQNCTLDLNGYTISSTKQFALRVNRANITFTITDGSANQDGVLLSEPTQTDQAYGVYIDKGTFVLQAGTIEAHLKADISAGVRAVNANAYFTMNGGTLHVETTNGKTAYAIYSAGTATVTNGKIYVTGSTAYVTNQASANANVVIQGGIYNTDAQLETCVSAPYHKFSLADESPYLYKVAEGYTVSFNNYDGTSLQSGVWEKGATPEYSGETPTKPADAQYTYTFDTWSPAISSVTANATYTATYNSTVNNYTVTIAKNVDGYGSISATEVASVPYGSTITVAGNTFTVNGTIVTATPETSDAQYTYTFDGWTNAPGTVTGNVTITANFTRTTNTYTVLWKDEDGTTLETDENVSYGTTPTYDGATPTKPADASYAYTFNGWSPAVGAITGTTEYTATYTTTPVVASVTVSGSTTYYTTFGAAWSAANSATAASTLKLLSDITVTSKLTYDNSNTQNCTLDLNGHTLTSSTGEQSPLHINKTGVTFTITDSGESGMLLLNTTSTSTIFGVYVQYGNLVLTGGTIEARSGTATVGAITVNSNGTFTMNGGTLHVVTTNNRNGRGVYSYNNVTINDGTIHVEAAGTGYGLYLEANKKATVNGGKFNISGSTANKSCICNTATANTNLLLLGGWYNTNLMTDGTTASNINTKYVAPGKSCNYHIFDLEGESPYLYKVAEGYTVTFNNYDDTSLQSSVWEKGAIPAYSGTPTKPADAQYTYTFDGWNAAIVPVTANVTYTAHYSSTVNTYTVLWKDEDGTILETDENVPYGSTPSFDGTTPTKPADEEYVHTFNGWDPAVGSITGNTEYAATYTTTPVVASVTISGSTTYYTTFDAAWSAASGAESASTITLLDDVTGLSASRTYSAAHNLTLDLNGHTLFGSSTDASLFQINSTGHTFTVTDGSANQEGMISFTATGSANSYCVMVNNGTFVLNAGKLYAESSSNAGVIGCVQANSGGTFTMIENGAVHTKYTGNQKNGRAVHANGGTTTIDGGTIRVESKTDGMGFVYVKGSVVTVNGGRFKITASGTAAVTNQNSENANLNIRGGYYSAKNNTYLTPHVKTPYHIFANADAEYPQKVAEGYTVTFNNYDGTSLQSGLWEKGAIPAYSGTPTKPADAQYTYTFNGWSPAISSVTADATYTATFTETVNTYTVTWKDEDGTILETDENVPYGTTPTYDGSTPTKPADEEYVYTFNGWDPAVGPITGNTEYTATYTTTPVVASVTISGVTTYYTAFNTAWTAVNNATSPSTIKLLQDVTATSILTYNNSNTQNCTLDLNGHTITSTQAALLNPTVSVTFTLTDSSEGKNGKLLSNATATGAAYGVLVSAGTFVLDAGTIEAHLQATISYGIRVAANTLFIMNGGLIDVETTNGKNGSGVYTHYNAGAFGTATINGGSIRVNAAAVGYAVENKGTTTITGGKFYATGTGSTACVVNTGTLTLHGGYYNVNTNLATYVEDPYQVLPNADETYPYKVAEEAQPEDIVVDANETVTIDNNTTTTTTTVHVSGLLEVSDNVTLTTNDLILEATPSSSGEIIGDVDATNAYFDLSNGTDGFKARTWYAIAVPWQVDVPAYNIANSGIYIKSGESDYLQQELGRTCDLIYYDGARRADGANKAWNYVEDDPAINQVMYPGRAYMIYLTADADVIRFKKSAGTVLHTDAVDVVKHESDLDAIYADWNGIANPATYKAYLDVGTTENWGQVYNPTTKGYDPFNLNSRQLQVGQPIFVQPIEAKKVEAERDVIGLAPLRVTESTNPFIRYEVVLAQNVTEVADRIIVRMDEEKEDNAYVVGQDLAKMGVSSVVPQMWVDRYDSRLCINTAIPTNNRADYPLSIFVPEAGDYILSITNDQSPIPNNAMLYLTYDGRAVWNLTYGGYVANLENGNNTHYGLRVVYVPQLSTGIEETTILNGEAVRKVIVNDNVFIIRGNNIYTVDGQMLK